MLNVQVLATAHLLPEEVVSNVEIGERLIAGGDSDPAAETVRQRARLIEKKTGLVSRRFFPPDAEPALVSLKILDELMSGCDWSALDAVIVSSSSTVGFPGVSQQTVAAARLAHPELGHPFVLDINSNACTSFMYAMHIAVAQVRAMGARTVACIAVEFSSRCIPYDPSAFGTSTLFGDAAAGVLVGEGAEASGEILEIRAHSHIDEASTGFIRGGGVSAHAPGEGIDPRNRWFMAGPPVAVGATRILSQEIERVRAQGVSIDWLIPHQANLTRILIPAAEKAGIDVARLRSSFAETGNTSSASIPLLLDQLLRSGDAKAGDTVLMVGFGASFTVGSALVRLH